MTDYVKINKAGGRIDLWFLNEDDEPFSVGEKLYAINKNAYMNGYNWNALFRHSLAKNNPELLEGLESDPEAGSYVAYYDMTGENEKKAGRFAEAIVSLIENEDDLFRLVREEGDEIEWD